MTHVGNYTIEKAGIAFVVKRLGVEVNRFTKPGDAANWCIRQIAYKASTQSQRYAR